MLKYNSHLVERVTPVKGKASLLAVPRWKHHLEQEVRDPRKAASQLDAALHKVWFQAQDDLDEMYNSGAPLTQVEVSAVLGPLIAHMFRPAAQGVWRKTKDTRTLWMVGAPLLDALRSWLVRRAVAEFPLPVQEAAERPKLPAWKDRATPRWPMFKSVKLPVQAMNKIAKQAWKDFQVQLASIPVNARTGLLVRGQVNKILPDGYPPPRWFKPHFDKFQSVTRAALDRSVPDELKDTAREPYTDMAQEWLGKWLKERYKYKGPIRWTASGLKKRNLSHQYGHTSDPLGSKPRYGRTKPDPKVAKNRWVRPEDLKAKGFDGRNYLQLSQNSWGGVERDHPSPLNTKINKVVRKRWKKAKTSAGEPDRLERRPRRGR